jgi:hypothetical protein
MKGFIHSATLIISSFFIIFTLLSLLNLLNYRLNYERFYIFYQGSYLAESFTVKIEKSQITGDLKVTNVPFNKTDPVIEVGKSYQSSTNIESSTYPYKYIFKIYLEYTTSIQKYTVLSKYSE